MCEKALRRLPRNIREYLCTAYTMFPGLKPGDFARGMLAILKQGVLPRPKDFEIMAAVYKANAWRNTWRTMIERLQVHIKRSSGDPFKQLLEDLKSSSTVGV
jgi:hypothetical protein